MTRTAFRTAIVPALAVIALLVTATPAAAGPHVPQFHPGIEAPAQYQGQTNCYSTAQPGVVSFRSLTLYTYPNTGDLGITRPCNQGGQSEHKEGRAWDWAASLYNSGQNAAVNDMLYWLLRNDEFNNTNAMARRTGVMYIIWNNETWRAYDPVWRSYTGADPHTSHVHFSFGWPGATQQTSWWTEGGAGFWLTSDVDTTHTGTGNWRVSKSGAVSTSGNAANHGSVSVTSSTGSIEGLTRTSDSGGYWLAGADGGVFALGNAGFYGSMGGQTLNKPVVGMSATWNNGGYWMVASDGGIFNFGNANFYGSMGGQTLNKPIVAIESTLNSAGYWMVARDGGIFSFGNAQFYGAIGTVNDVVGMARTTDGAGYWLVRSTGHVYAYGSATYHGGAAGITPTPIANIASRPGGGYVLTNSNNQTYQFP